MALYNYIETPPHTTSNGKTRTLVLEWSASNRRYDVNTKKVISTINWTVRGGGTYSGYVNCKNVYYSIGPHSDYALGSTATAVYPGQILARNSFDIVHNEADGSAKFNIYLTGFIYYYGENNRKTAPSTTHDVDPLTTTWRINFYKPAENGVYSQAIIGTFDEYVKGIKVNTIAQSEGLSNYARLPLGTDVAISNIQPHDGYEFWGVWNGSNHQWDGKIESSNGLTGGEGMYGHTIAGDNDDLYIYTKWKTSKIYFDNGKEVDVTYNSSNNNRVAIPEKSGYEFLGWFTEDGVEIYNSKGEANHVLRYWENGICKLYNDLYLYARWDEKNVIHIKVDKDGWQTALSYIKIMDNESNIEKWNPAMIYVKTESGWQRSTIK